MQHVETVPRQSGPESMGLRKDPQMREVCALPEPPKGLESEALDGVASSRLLDTGRHWPEP